MDRQTIESPLKTIELDDLKPSAAPEAVAPTALPKAFYLMTIVFIVSSV